MADNVTPARILDVVDNTLDFGHLVVFVVVANNRSAEASSDSWVVVAAMSTSDVVVGNSEGGIAAVETIAVVDDTDHERWVADLDDVLVAYHLMCDAFQSSSVAAFVILVLESAYGSSGDFETLPPCSALVSCYSCIVV